jgi:GrpB-like predicted nucleotidyltransferase (UPF0157 family)
MDDPVVIVEYDSEWPQLFSEIAGHVRQTLPPTVLIGIEHVGSTAVPGLAAKPVIDMIIVIPSQAELSAAITHLAGLGYVYEGDLGITGRFAFRWPPGMPQHHLYLCSQDSEALRDQVLFRDYLRTHDDEARQYEALKRDLAMRFRHHRKAYSDGKTDYVHAVLEKTRTEPSERVSIPRILF